MSNCWLNAREVFTATTDAALLDEALRITAEKPSRGGDWTRPTRRYDEHPIDEPDEWGDLATFRSAAAAT